jgi:hypothetical protein
VIYWLCKFKIAVVVAIYFTQNKKDALPRNDVVASVTRILISSLKVA